MSLLTICQDVADVIGLTRPTAIVSGTDQISRQFLGIAKEVLEELGEMAWPVLEVPYSFPTVVSQSQYSLPADFACETADTAYLATQYYKLRGSLSAGDWARQRNALPSQIGRYKFRIFGLPLKLNMTPAPTTVETVVLEYKTVYRVQQADTSYKNTWYADDDVPLLPDDLVKKGIKWRIRRAKGLDYSEEFNDYEIARRERLAQALTLGSMPVAYRNLTDGTSDLSTGYVPEFGFGV